MLLIDLPGNLLHFRLQPSIKVQKTLRQRYVRQRGIDKWPHEDEVFVGAPEGLGMPVAGGEPKPSVVMLHPEYAGPPIDTVMTFIAMMSHPLRGWSL